MKQKHTQLVRPQFSVALPKTYYSQWHD